MSKHRIKTLRWIGTFAVAMLAFASVGHSASGAESSRFTDTLSTVQRTESGLDRLSSDNVAVINALVRQDQATLELRNNTIRTTRFSQRRTEHEREIAGLGVLSPEQLDRLDGLVGIRLAPPPSLALDASYTPSRINVAAIENVSRPLRPEIHGSFSLMYGWGGGGTVKGGDATLIFQDPEHRYSVVVNYSQYKGDGYLPPLYPYGGYYPRRPFADGSIDR